MFLKQEFKVVITYETRNLSENKHFKNGRNCFI